MKFKTLGLAALSAMVLTACAASSASATTLAITGETQNQSVTKTESLETGSSMVLSRTDGSLANTCTAAHTHSHSVEPYSNPVIFWELTSSSVSNCTRPVTIHKAGTLSTSRIAGTPDATVSSIGAEITVSTPFGTVNCKTGAGTDIGRMTGGGPATMDLNAVLNCGILLPSASWKGTYVVTSPHNLTYHD